MISGVNQSSVYSYRVNPVPSVLQKKDNANAKVENREKYSQSHIKPSTTQLSSEDQARIQELKLRDTEVKTHEQAHVATGGQYVTGGPTYSFQQGPDGHRYAIGGEVGIDPSPESDPEATIQKMQVVRAAALAPAQPSSQDRQVAATASRQANEARATLRREQIEEQKQDDETQWASSSPGDIFDVRA